MSSLLQHHGGRSKRGIELLMYLVRQEPIGETGVMGNVDAEPVKLQRPDGSFATVPKLYRIYRKPAGTFGCWVVFRWNGEEHIPDLSCPIDVQTLPRDATSLTHDEAAAYWFKSGAIHGTA
jgi:hypothetical protein